MYVYLSICLYVYISLFIYYYTMHEWALRLQNIPVVDVKAMGVVVFVVVPLVWTERFYRVL